MRKKVYGSDVSLEQFEWIRPLLEGVRKRTKPRTVDLYEVFCGVLYLLKTGCQWRMLPDGFPKWRTVHSYFQKWSEPGPDGVSVLERALKKISWQDRARQGRSCSTSFLIVDAQSVKKTDTASQKGLTRARRCPASSATSRWIPHQGLPHAVAVTTAEVTDRKGALAAFERCASNLQQVTSVLVDGGYSGKPFAEAVENKLGATVQVAKRNELHAFAVMPQRWVVERSFAWLEKCRRLWKNCERKLNTSLQMIHLAFLVLLLRRS